MNKKNIVLLSIMLFLRVFCIYAQNNSKNVESQLPEGKNWKLIWNDEFDGISLDTTKWGYRLHLIQRRHETWTNDAAELDGEGNLLLKVYEKDGKYYSSQLQTGRNYLDRPGDPFPDGKQKFVWPVAKMEPAKFIHKYGYYEIRCKLPKQQGWWAAFWLQSPTIGCSLDPTKAGVEIDIMENFTRDGTIFHKIFWNGYGADRKSKSSGPVKIPELKDDNFHTFGLFWNKRGYIFYVDGKETLMMDGPVSDVEQFVMITTECMGYREGDDACEPLKNAKMPDYFVVDYVRVFDEVE